MKTIEITGYSTGELSDKAKETAYYDWLNNWEYYQHDDNMNSIREFCKIFDCEITDYEYGYRYDYSFNTEYDDEELSKLDLLAKVYFNYLKVFKHAKYKESSECQLTGYYIDEILLDTIRKFLHEQHHYSYRDLIEECFDKAFSHFVKDYEYTSSMEYFEEYCEANDCYFTENGKLI